MLKTQCVLNIKPIQEWNLYGFYFLLDGTSYEGEVMRLALKAVVSSSEELNAGDDSVRGRHGKAQKC